ncbi:MAG TPA: ABC transporter permease [Planctomycetota bacterium]|nr:ABC transporter permease [Planctomycetota bacterium]
MKRRALTELMLARTREFYREPEAVFWVYVFPILLMAGLGIAFRGGGKEEIVVDVIEGSGAASAKEALESPDGARKRFKVDVVSAAEARSRHAIGKTDVIVDASGGALRYTYDPSRSGSEAAKISVDGALQAAAGRKDLVSTSENLITEPGSRYIDWLIPGILGMNIMGGGMWGLGFVTVDMRMRKLLKRFIATPMARSDFLLALMGSRLLFLVPEVIVILAVGHFIFGLEIRGSFTSLAAVTFLGAISFSGLGLLIACRADKIETVSGLMNFVMLPMWMLSGIFFSSNRFPDAMQPFVQALPLTQLNNALRAVILEGSSAADQWVPALVLAAYAVVSFSAALRWFKWQ